MSHLTRSIADRILVGLLGLLLGPVAGSILLFHFMYSGSSHDPDWLIRALDIFCMEAVAVVFTGSCLGVVWACFTPDWIEHRLRQTFRFFMVLLLAFGFACVVLLLWSAFHTS